MRLLTLFSYHEAAGAGRVIHPRTPSKKNLVYPVMILSFRHLSSAYQTPSRWRQQPALHGVSTVPGTTKALRIVRGLRLSEIQSGSSSPSRSIQRQTPTVGIVIRGRDLASPLGPKGRKRRVGLPHNDLDPFAQGLRLLDTGVGFHLAHVAQ